MALSSMTHAHRPVECELDPERFNALASKLAATGEGWEISIDRGTVVIQGPRIERLSVEAHDAWVEASSHMSVHLEAQVAIYKITKPAEEADGAWALQQGVRGLRYVTDEEYWTERIREEQQQQEQETEASDSRS